MPTESAPFQLKNIYSEVFLYDVARELTATWPEFPGKTFLQRVFDEQWPKRELKQRTRHIAECMHATLPPEYAQAVDIIVRTVERMIARSGDQLSFIWGIFPDFVEAFGPNEPDISIPALEIITRLSSAEFAVRPFLLRYPERMHAQMLAWAGHSSPMVRRLSSEGIRPRLPWGMGVPALKKDPSPVLPILEQLKNDPAETVRRSVANNLNDISKEHPDLVLDIARRWKGQSVETDWVVRHACRGLLKKGHPEALRLFGFDAALLLVTVEQLTCPAQVNIGERLHFSFMVHNKSDELTSVRLEYAIDYITSTGKISRKVFKISEFAMAPRQVMAFAKNQRFTDFTTRKHYPGRHKIAILVNGIEQQSALFDVTP